MGRHSLVPESSLPHGPLHKWPQCPHATSAGYPKGGDKQPPNTVFLKPNLGSDFLSLLSYPVCWSSVTQRRPPSRKGNCMKACIWGVSRGSPPRCLSVTVGHSYNKAAERPLCALVARPQVWETRFRSSQGLQCGRRVRLHRGFSFQRFSYMQATVV